MGRMGKSPALPGVATRCHQDGNVGTQRSNGGMPSLSPERREANASCPEMDRAASELLARDRLSITQIGVLCGLEPS